MNKYQAFSDKAAIGLSLLCTIHCLLLPLITLLLPALALSFINDESVHEWLLYGVVPISLFALGLGFAHHKSLQVLLLGSIGLLILILLVSFGPGRLSPVTETIFSVTGSAIIAFSHIRNHQLRQQRQTL